jgi:hypothetical protein
MSPLRGLAILLALSALACANTSTFQTNPRGARVYVNGEPCGESPCKYDTRYGFPDRIRVQIEKEGYRPEEFFLDTEPPIATYALFGFGSYLFHTFDEEYRFDLRPAPGEAKPAVAVPVAVVATASPDLTDPDAAMSLAAQSQMELANGQGDCVALAQSLEQPTLSSAVSHFGQRATLRKQVTCARSPAADVYACEAEFVGVDFAVYVRFFATAKETFAPRCFVAGASQR